MFCCAESGRGNQRQAPDASQPRVGKRQIEEGRVVGEGIRLGQAPQEQESIADGAPEQSPMPVLACPVCLDPLTLADAGVTCSRGHSFDRASEGYFNLLLPGQRSLGDTREMLTARRRFLEAGHYSPLAEEIAERIGALIAGRFGDRPIRLLDVGCGEGYYLRRLRALLAERATASQSASNRPGNWTLDRPRESPVKLELYGADLSRDAVRLAAKADRATTYVVADTRRLPFFDSSLDVVLDVFAPRSTVELSRMIRPTGWLLVVIPDASHLAELRSLPGVTGGIGIEPEKRRHVVEGLSASFDLLEERSVRVRLLLSVAALADLLGMTPTSRHLSETDWAAVRTSADTTVSAEFRLLVFGRRG